MPLMRHGLHAEWWNLEEILGSCLAIIFLIVEWNRSPVENKICGRVFSTYFHIAK